MNNKKIITAIAALSLIPLAGITVINRISPSVKAVSHSKINHHRFKKQDKHVYIVQVSNSNAYAYCTPSTKHKRGRIYLPKHTRLHVYNTVKKNNKTFYEIKSHRYIQSTNVNILE